MMMIMLIFILFMLLISIISHSNGNDSISSSTGNIEYSPLYNAQITASTITTEVTTTTMTTKITSLPIPPSSSLIIPRPELDHIDALPYLSISSIYSKSEKLHEPIKLVSFNGKLNADLAIRSYRYDNGFIAFNTRVYCYLDYCSIPGPSLNCKPGDVIEVRLTNELDTNGKDSYYVNSTNFYIHGLHIDPTTNDVTKSTGGNGKVNVYKFKVPDDHHPGNHWYHSHKHGTSALHVMGGLIGSLTVSPSEPSDIPIEIASMTRMNLIFSHINLDSNKTKVNLVDGAVDIFSYQRLSDKLKSSLPVDATFADSTVRDLWLTNGQYQPTHTMRPGEWQVFDMLAASGDRILEIEIRTAVGTSNGNYACDVNVLAIDGVYLDKTRTGPLAKHLVLVQGSRASIAVRCPVNGTYYLQSASSMDPSSPYWKVGDLDTKSSQNLLTLKIDGDFIYDGEDGSLAPPIDLSSIPRPSYLRKNTSILASERIWSISLDQTQCPSNSHQTTYWMGMGSDCTLACFNKTDCYRLYGESYCIQSLPTVMSKKCLYDYFGSQVRHHSAFEGMTEILSLWSWSGMSHALHIPTNHFQFLSHDDGQGTNLGTLYGAPGDWRDTWPSLKGESVLRTLFTEFIGNRIIHNNYLNYEDDGLLATIDIVQAPPTPAPLKVSNISTTTKPNISISTVTNDGHLINDPRRPVDIIAAGFSISPDQFLSCFNYISAVPQGSDVNELRVLENKQIVLPCLQTFNSEISNSLIDDVMNQYQLSIAAVIPAADFAKPISLHYDNCDVDGKSFYYKEIIDVKNRLRTIISNSCPNHFSACQKEECSGEQSSLAKPHNITISIPLFPLFSKFPIDTTCTLDSIAIALNGVPIKGPSDGSKKCMEPSIVRNISYGKVPCSLHGLNDGIQYCGDAVQLDGREFDKCGGHSDYDGVYHYHIAPVCLIEQMLSIKNLTGVNTPVKDDSFVKISDFASPQIGWAYDGFPVYGPYGPFGIFMAPCNTPGANADVCLDSCNGYYGKLPGIDDFMYRYYMSGEHGEGNCSSSVQNVGDCRRNTDKCCTSTVPSAVFTPYSIGCYRGCLQKSGCSSSGELGYTDTYIPSVTKYPKEIVAQYSYPRISIKPPILTSGAEIPLITIQPSQPANDTASFNVGSRFVAVRIPSNRSVVLATFKKNLKGMNDMSTEEIPSTKSDTFISDIVFDKSSSSIYYATESGIYSFDVNDDVSQPSSPTSQPFIRPTTQPLTQPTSQPSGQPSSQPSLQPSRQPSSQPSSQPSGQPTSQPSLQPSQLPEPSLQPLSEPSLRLTSQPSQPSSKPSSNQIIGGILVVEISGYNFGNSISDIYSVTVQGSPCTSLERLNSENIKCVCVTSACTENDVTVDDVVLSTIGGNTQGIYKQPYIILKSGTGRPVVSNILLTKQPFIPNALSLVRKGENAVLYWSNIGIGSYSIQRCRLNGTQIETISTGIQKGLGLHVIPRNDIDVIFFTDGSKNSLYRLSAPAMTSQIFDAALTPLGQAVPLITGLQTPTDVYVEDLSSFLFLTVLDGYLIRISLDVALSIQPQPTNISLVLPGVTYTTNFDLRNGRKSLPSWAKLINRGSSMSRYSRSLAIPSCQCNYTTCPLSWNEQRIFIADTNQQQITLSSDYGYPVSSVNVFNAFPGLSSIVWPIAFASKYDIDIPQICDEPIVLYVAEYLGKIWEVIIPRNKLTGIPKLDSLPFPKLLFDESSFVTSSTIRNILSSLPVQRKVLGPQLVFEMIS